MRALRTAFGVQSAVVYVIAVDGVEVGVDEVFFIVRSEHDQHVAIIGVYLLVQYVSRLYVAVILILVKQRVESVTLVVSHGVYVRGDDDEESHRQCHPFQRICVC